MNSLTEIKNTYAQEQGYEDWLEFVASTDHLSNEWFEKHMNEICIRAQKAALEKAAGKIYSYTTLHSYLKIDLTRLIDTPENLIR